MGPLMLIILDGFGLGKDYKGNAVKLANTPTLDRIIKNFPYTSLDASGEEVGLPSGQIGNSEVGHLNIGAGRIVYQDLSRINMEIESGKFNENESFIRAAEHAIKNDKKIHLIGLTSYGGVHSHMNHLKALIKLFKNQGVKETYIHSILDGRDVHPRIAKKDIEGLQLFLQEVEYGNIATVIGRYYAMDRDKKWDRTKVAYDLFVEGLGGEASDPVEWIDSNYKMDISDEFVRAGLVNKDGLIEKGDVVIFFNFRPDRMRQITEALTQDNFKGFEIKEDLDLNAFTITQYNEDFMGLEIVYKPET